MYCKGNCEYLDKEHHVCLKDNDKQRLNGVVAVCLLSANQIINITFDTNHMCYVVIWRYEKSYDGGK